VKIFYTSPARRMAERRRREGRRIKGENLSNNFSTIPLRKSRYRRLFYKNLL
jgi:hypothetical protein